MASEITPRTSPLALLVLAGVTLAVFARALFGELVYDDLDMIARNPQLGQLGSIPGFFTQSHWAFLGERDAAYSGYWRPLAATALTLANVLGGGSTVVFHAVCLATHLAATWVAYLLALRLSGSQPAALFAGLIFGVHPVHVESVAWITALNDPLFGLFSLLALLGYLRWREGGSRGLPWLAAVAFALALLSKELAVAVLPMAVVLDLTRPGRQEPAAGTARSALLRGCGTLLGVLALYFVARMGVFGSPWAGLDRANTYFGVGWGREMVMRLEIVGGGLGLLAWPLQLEVFREVSLEASLGDPRVQTALLALIVFVGLALWSWSRERWGEVAGLLLVVAGLTPTLVDVESLGRFLLSDRFLYLPVLGFGLYLALLALRLLPRPAALGALSLVVVALGVRSFDRVGIWADEQALFTSAVEDNPRSAYARWGLGRVLLERYEEERDPLILARAMAQFEEAQILAEEVLTGASSDLFVSSTDVLQANLGFAWCLLHEAEIDEYHDYATPAAIFRQLLTRIYEMRAEAQAAAKGGAEVLMEPLAVEYVHYGLGVAEMAAGRLAEAEKAFRDALVENPNYAEAHIGLGRLMLQSSQPKRALHHLEQGVDLAPRHYGARLLLAQALMADGWIDRAVVLAEELVAEDNTKPQPMEVLGMAAGLRKDYRTALRWYEEACEADPDFGDAWYNRALALLALENEQEAILSFRRAVDLLPNNFEVRFNFGSLLLRSGALETAATHLIRAYGLCRDPQLAVQLRENLLQLPLNPDQAVTLSVVERGLGRLPAAELWVDRALQLAPGNVEALLQKARVRRDQNDLGGAIEALNAARGADPKVFVVLFELGLALSDVGRLEDALDTLREARALGPPASWRPEEAQGLLQKLDESIRALEAGRQAPFVGPPVDTGG